MVKVFLDDERDAPNGWQRVYTVEQAIGVLQSRQVEFISLDNDLGYQDPRTEGFNVVNWIEAAVNDDPTFPIPHMTVHSSNAARAQSMRQAIKRLDLIREEQRDFK